MSLTDEEILELHELLDALVENNLAGKRLRRLEEWLIESESVRRRYARFMDMSASLRHYAEECFAEEDEDADIVPFERQSEGLLRFVRPLLAVAAVVALAFVGIQSYQRSQVGTDELSQKPPLPSSAPKGDIASVGLLIEDAVGQLTKATGVEWASDSQLHLNRGNSLAAGPLKLETGLAQIEMLSGATLVLEGPADFELLSDDEVFLTKGKLRVMVPPAAAGFAVNMPMGKVIDLGTEFGLHVMDDGAAEIYVYIGKVLFEGKDLDAERAFAELEAGESVFVDEMGELAWIDMPSEHFFGAADLAHRSMEEAQNRYGGWVELSEELADDDRTSLYFTFDDHRTWDRALRDEARTKEEAEDGAIIGCQWVEGRWPGKGALRFSGANDRVKLRLDESMTSLTMATWVRLDRLRKDFNPIVQVPAKTKGALTWGIDGRGRMLLRSHRGSEFVEYASSVVFLTKKIGHWIHLATTCDDQDNKVTHYLDGRPYSRENLRGNAPMSVDGGELGNVISDGKASAGGRNLRGTIDEFIVFRQALSSDEIRRLYEIGRPYSLPSLNRLP